MRQNIPENGICIGGSRKPRIRMAAANNWLSTIISCKTPRWL
jgi:hypothetical protein